MSSATHPPYIIGKGEESRQERADRGFSREDTFSFDTYVAGVIAGGVRELQRRGLGCPGGFRDEEGLTLEERCKAWEELLGEMACGFEAYVEATASSAMFEHPDGFKRSMELFTTWFGALWD